MNHNVNYGTFINAGSLTVTNVPHQYKMLIEKTVWKMWYERNSLFNFSTNLKLL